jgi:hypothetical protein
MDLFRTIETIFIPGWICFVPLKLFLYETDPFVRFFVFVCVCVSLFYVIDTGSIGPRARTFVVVYNLKHTVHFSQPKMSQNLYCATGCTPRMDLFRTIETFFIPGWYKKSFNSRNPFESFESSEKLGG